MRISELEKALRDAVRTYPGRPALALLTGDGVAVPEEFAESARSLAGRTPRTSLKDSILQAKAEWAQEPSTSLVRAGAARCSKC